MDPALIVNFGGPRDLEEIFSFLEELLLDPDVVPQKLPSFLHRPLFRRIARKRSLSLKKEYSLMGGKSPIFFDTEEIASHLSKILQRPFLTFHRYLPKTHAESLQKIEECASSSLCVFPLFPQFTYTTTGSIARFFSRHLSPSSLKKLRWLPSYSNHPLFVSAMQKKISAFMLEKKLPEDLILFFSAHGIPLSFIQKGDPYQTECEASFAAICQAFPKAQKQLAYQSKFGRGEWLKPYTLELVENPFSWNPQKKPVLFIPLSFPSDHIETLVEIEHQYVAPLLKQNIPAYRCPALNQESYWLDALSSFFSSPSLFSTSTEALFRR